MDDNNGTTTVLIHTNKGKNAINDIDLDIRIIEINEEEALKYDGKKILHSASDNSNKEQYFKAMNEYGYMYAQNKYAKATLKEILITILKRTILKNNFFKRILKKVRDNKLNGR